MDSKDKKVMILIGILMVIVVAGIAYAAFTQSLNISGTAENRNSSWNIYINSVSAAQTTGTARELVHPSTTSGTTIGNYAISVTSPGDTVSYEIEVKNDGDYDALLSDFTINSTPTCSVDGIDPDNSATKVCNNLTYSIVYKGGAQLQKNVDVLPSKGTARFVIKLVYNDFNNASNLPSVNVNITGLGVSLDYIQSGKAKVNVNGTTPQRTYNVTYHLSNYCGVTYSDSSETKTITVTEGALLTNTTPETIETGSCSFKSWNYDFTSPVTSNLDIYAKYNGSTCDCALDDNKPIAPIITEP